MGTKMFHFPTFPPTTLYIQVEATRHNPGEVTPFGNPRIKTRLPTPRGLSQITTSFIGSRCQGIHRLPRHPPTALSSLPKNKTTKMLASTIKFSKNNTKTKNTKVPTGISKRNQTTNGRSLKTQQRAHSQKNPQPKNTPNKTQTGKAQNAQMVSLERR